MCDNRHFAFAEGINAVLKAHNKAGVCMGLCYSILSYLPVF